VAQHISHYIIAGCVLAVTLHYTHTHMLHTRTTHTACFIITLKSYPCSFIHKPYWHARWYCQC